MNFEVTIPGLGAEDMVLNLTIDAPNWMEALQLGLAEIGNELMPADGEIDLQPDGVVRVLQRSTGRTFVVAPVGQDGSPVGRKRTQGRNLSAATLPNSGPAPGALAETTSAAASAEPSPKKDERERTATKTRNVSARSPPEGDAPPRRRASTRRSNRQLDNRTVHDPEPYGASDEVQRRPRQRLTPIPPNKVAVRPSSPSSQRPTTNPISMVPPPILTRNTLTSPPSPLGPGSKPGDGAGHRFATTPLSKGAVRDAHSHVKTGGRHHDDDPGLTDAQIMSVVQDALPSIESDFATAEQVIDAAVDLAHSTIPCESVVFLLPAGDPRRGRVVGARGKPVRGFLGTVLPLTDDVADVLLGRRSLVNLNTVDWTLRFQGRHQGVLSLDVRSIIWAPIMHRGRLVSTLVLANSKRRAGFSEGEHTAVEQMCMSLAKALVMYL